MSKIPSKLQPDTVFHGGSGQTPPPAAKDTHAAIKKLGYLPEGSVDTPASKMTPRAHPAPPAASNEVAPVRDDLK